MHLTWTNKVQGGLSMGTDSKAHPIKMCEMVSDSPEKDEGLSSSP